MIGYNDETGRSAHDEDQVPAHEIPVGARVDAVRRPFGDSGRVLAHTESRNQYAADPRTYAVQWDLAGHGDGYTVDDLRVTS